MPHAIMLIPAEINVSGLTSVSLGIVCAMERKNIHINVFKPITQPGISGDALDKIVTIIRKHYNLLVVDPIKIRDVEFMLTCNQKDRLMEKIIANYYVSAKDAEVVLIIGLTTVSDYQFAQSLNYEIAKILNAEIVFVVSQYTNSLKRIMKRIELMHSNFDGRKKSNISGIIFNKINAPVNEYNCIYSDISTIFLHSSEIKEKKTDLTAVFKNSLFPILGAIPWNSNLIVIRIIDIIHYLNAVIINDGNLNAYCVRSIIFCTYSISHMLEHLCEDSLLVISTDRSDILIAACLAIMNGIKIRAILLTGNLKLDACVNKLCKYAFATGVSVFSVNTDIWQTFLKLQNLNLEIPIDDFGYIKKIQEHIANHINMDWIKSLTVFSKCSYHSSPIEFRYQLTELARKANKRIILPEGTEPRTIQAAVICAKKNIATCILLGNPKEIMHIAASQNIILDTNIEIIDPDSIRKNYIDRLIELRKNKGMTFSIACKQLEDNVVLGTLMLEQNKVDGLVSGAIHTTANTIRPSLQLIKTESGSSLVSSIFFMLLPEQVYVYGDCAINTNPTVEQLAEIAIQSANSASMFGIDPFVAMLSYSTGTSGTGVDVEKVHAATLLVKKRRPDLIVDGPLQYDAAVVSDIAKFKAPDSQVAGQATVFIFPDLNSGNITYKAVQRSANVISIGPMLQGMRKPVNDLSRGASVDDIVYTIALTAVQAFYSK